MTAVAVKYRVRRLTQLVGITSPLVDRMQVDVDCHTDLGDGGGGTFVWDASSTATADGGTILGTGTGRWKRVLSGYVTPEMFGAVGDGGEDDTLPLQAALDTLLPVRCKRGATYRVTRQAIYADVRYYCLVWKSYMRLDLNGATIKLANSQAYTSVFVSQSWLDSSTVYETEMHGGFIDGNQSNQTYVSGITPTCYFGYHVDSSWHDITIKNALWGGFYCAANARNHLDNIVVRTSNGQGVQLLGDSWNVGSVKTYDTRYLLADQAPGNPFIALITNSVIGEIYAENPAFGFKLQNGSENVSIGSINVECGSNKDAAAIVALYGEMAVKFEGSPSVSYPKNISVGNITIKDAPGGGLYCFQTRGLSISNLTTLNCGTRQDSDTYSNDFRSIDSEVTIASMVSVDSNYCAVRVQTTATAYPCRIGKLSVRTSIAGTSNTISNDSGQLIIDELHVYRRNSTNPLIYASSKGSNYTRVGRAYLDIDMAAMNTAGAKLLQSFSASPGEREIVVDQIEFADAANEDIVVLSGTTTAKASAVLRRVGSSMGPTRLNLVPKNADARTLLDTGGVTYSIGQTGYSLHHPSATAVAAKFQVQHGGYVAPYRGPLRNDTLTGLATLSGSAYAQVAAPAGLRGHASGFWVAALWTPNDLTNGEQIWRSYAAAGGARFFKASTTSLVFQVVAGDGTTTISSPSYTMSAGDLDTVMGMVGVYDQAAGLVRLYVNRVEVGSGTAITGHTVATGSAINIIGLSMHASSILHGVLGADGTYPSLANIQAWFDATQIENGIASMPGAPEDHSWQVTELLAPLDGVGSDHLALVGTGHTLSSEASPTWGW